MNKSMGRMQTDLSRDTLEYTGLISCHEVDNADSKAQEYWRILGVPGSVANYDFKAFFTALPRNTGNMKDRRSQGDKRNKATLGI